MAMMIDRKTRAARNRFSQPKAADKQHIGCPNWYSKAPLEGKRREKWSGHNQGDIDLDELEDIMS